MPASITDYFNKVINGSTRPVATTLSAQKVSGANTASVVSTTGWDTSTALHGIMYRTDASNRKIDGSQIDWKATVSGTTLSNFQVTAGSDDTYEVGTTVELAPTSAWADDIMTGLLVGHTQAGLHTLGSSDTITSSKFLTALNDTNGNELLRLTATGSAVNELTLANAATAGLPTLSATGGDANVSIAITPKGTGRIQLSGAGAPDTASVAASETTTSTTYTALATAQAVTVTVGTSGKMEVTVGAGSTANNTANAKSYMSFALSGANTLAAADSNSAKFQAYTANAEGGTSRTILLTGLNAGSTTVTAQFKVENGGGGSGTGTWVNRNLIATPVQ